MNEQETRKVLDQFMSIARASGYEIRHELLDGAGSGLCEIRGKKCLILDIGCGPAEQLDSIKQTLSSSQGGR